MSTSAPIRIDFCDFWPGFRKTDNFFFNLLKRWFNAEVTDQPDYVFYADPASHLHRLHNCVRIYFGIESYLPDWSTCDYALTCHPLADPRHYRLPLYVVYGGPEPIRKENEDPAAILAAKTRFCGFVVSNANKGASQRIDFFHRLSRYKEVASGGRLFNNIGGPLPDGPAGKLEFLRTCKFNIAFENARIPGYTTEKIYEAMKARTLPIYWGDPNIATEFNPRSFLNAADFPSDDALVERIIELDRNDEQYLEMMRQPYLHDNQSNPAFDMKALRAFFETVFATPITPVARRRKWWQPGRWVLAKRTKA